MHTERMAQPPGSSCEPFQRGDEALARLVSAGSGDAFSTLYERYHELLYRYCRSILLHEADAHDAVQSTFIRAFEALRRGQRDAPLRPWLFRIAHNESISMLRRRRAAGELPSKLGVLSIPTEERAAHREQVGLLLEDLQELPARQRGAIVMRELGGLSHDEIAAALATSVSGARQAIFEARSALSEFAEGRALACEDVRRELDAGDRRILRRRSIRAHLRDCAACAAFAATLPERRSRLRVLGAPLFAGPARALARLSGSSAGTGGGGAAGWSGGFLTAAANDLAAGMLTAKPLAALAVVLTTAAGGGTIAANLSGASGAATAGASRTAPLGRAASPAAQAFLVAPAAGESRQSSATKRGVGFGLDSPSFTGLSRRAAAGRGSPGSAERIPTGAARGNAANRSSSPVAAQNTQSSGRENRDGAAAQAPGHSAPPGQTSSQGGNGNAGSPPGQTRSQGGNGNAGSPPGQTRSHGGNGNAGSPPGQTRSQGGNGNAGSPPGQAKGHGGNGNGGSSPGQAKGNGGSGNSGTPPGQAKAHAGNGNAGSPPGQASAPAAAQSPGHGGGQAASANSASPPGLSKAAGGNSGNGNSGQPLGQANGHGGNGNPGQPPGRG